MGGPSLGGATPDPQRVREARSLPNRRPGGEESARARTTARKGAQRPVSIPGSAPLRRTGRRKARPAPPSIRRDKPRCPHLVRARQARPPAGARAPCSSGPAAAPARLAGNLAEDPAAGPPRRTVGVALAATSRSIAEAADSALVRPDAPVGAAAGVPATVQAAGTGQGARPIAQTDASPRAAARARAAAAVGAAGALAGAIRGAAADARGPAAAARLGRDALVPAAAAVGRVGRRVDAGLAAAGGPVLALLLFPRTGKARPGLPGGRPGEEHRRPAEQDAKAAAARRGVRERTDETIEAGGVDDGPPDEPTNAGGRGSQVSPVSGQFISASTNDQRPARHRFRNRPAPVATCNHASHDVLPAVRCSPS